MMHNRVLRASLFLVVCLGLGTLAGIFSAKYYQEEPASRPAIDGLLWPEPKTIKPFALVDQADNTFNQEDISGHWTFLFFGYTNCPDICPITLSVMDRVYRQLQELDQAANVQMVFVTVDPDRDTPGKMASYVDYFNSDFIGLTGSEQQLGSLTGQMGIAYVHGEETAPGEYLVDHTASIFLVSPQKELVGIFSSPHEAQDIIDRFLAIRNFINGQEG